MQLGRQESHNLLLVFRQQAVTQFDTSAGGCTEVGVSAFMHYTSNLYRSCRKDTLIPASVLAECFVFFSWCYYRGAFTLLQLSSVALRIFIWPHADKGFRTNESPRVGQAIRFVRWRSHTPR